MEKLKDEGVLAFNNLINPIKEKVKNFNKK